MRVKMGLSLESPAGAGGELGHTWYFTLLRLAHATIPIFMRRFPIPVVIAGFATVTILDATTVYQNSFSSPTDLSAYTILSNGGSMAVANGQAVATVSSNFGHEAAMLSTGAFDAPYVPVLSNNPGLVSWSFNVSNQDGPGNNGFEVYLASTTQDPRDTLTPSCGYYFGGGGYVGNRMGLWRYGTGIVGAPVALIDITSGLATLPQKGSFRITFDPGTGNWRLYGTAGTSYVDPQSVTTLLGTATDTSYTALNTAWFGFGGTASGTDYVDNGTVTGGPEPSAAVLASLGLGIAGWIGRRR